MVIGDTVVRKSYDKDITFKIIDETTRVLVLKPYGDKYVNICEAILW